MPEPTLFIDASRLIKRFGRATPTGIDRVELAYAKHFRATFGKRVRIGYAFGGRMITLSDGRVDDFLAATEQSWTSDGTQRTRAGMREIERKLGVRFDGVEITRPVRSGRPDRTGILIDLGTQGMGRMVRPLRPEEGPRTGDTLIGVSHMGLGRRGPVRAIMRRTGLRAVFLLHDLIPISHPEYSVPIGEARHHERMETMLSLAALLIANSRDTLDVASRYARHHDLSMPPAVVAHLGLEPVWFSATRPALSERPYFVCVGTIEARKNHLLLLNVWRRLAERYGADAPRLVIVGRRGWENEQVVDMLERCAQLRDNVIECADLPDEALKSLLGGARALLFPSFVEGYGLPLAEAVAAGVPVIASDLPVFRELAGDAPDYLDPLDGLGWIRAVEDYARPDSGRRADQVDRIAGLEAPTWAAHFAAVTSEMSRLGLI